MSITPMGPPAAARAETRTTGMQPAHQPIANQPTKRQRRVDVSQHFVALANRLIALRSTTTHRSEQASDFLSKSIGVASCTSKGGATTVAANIAIATTVAVDGDVLLIETTPRSRGGRRPGWLDVLHGDVPLDDALFTSDVDGLVRMHAGVDIGPSLIDPERVRELIGDLKHRFEFIFVDLPQASDLTQCYPIAAALDGVLLVVHANKVSTTRAVRVTKELEQAGANVVGVVLNKKRYYVPKLLRRLLPFLSESES